MTYDLALVGKPVCYNCDFRVEVNEVTKQGMCHGVPPQAQMIGPGQAATLRPAVGPSDRACSLFTAKRKKGE